MDWFQVIALSVIQGLTEFLPISSSAHLILPSQILGWPDQGLAFDVAVHVGTLLAVILYFRRDVAQLTVGWGKSMAGIKSDEGRIAWLIILGTLPAGISGLVFGDYIEENLRSGLVIATTTIIFALALWWADKSGSRTKEIAQMGWQIALVIGVSQAIALIPGTSRSGITMTAALLLGFTRESSAKFSFLLSIPLIAAAGMLKTKELMETGTDAQWVMVSAGVVMSFLSAYACIHFFLNFLERLGFFPYVIYRLLLGVCLFCDLAIIAIKNRLFFEVTDLAINTSGSLLYPAAVGTTYAGRVESAQRRDNDERARQERSLPQQSVDLVAFQREAESRFTEKVQTLTPADSLQNLPYESRKAISLYENNQYARSPDEDGLERGVDIFI